jgi:hypothetical protein
MVRCPTLTPCTSLGDCGFSIVASEGGSEDEERRESLGVFIAVVTSIDEMLVGWNVKLRLELLFGFASALCTDDCG